MYIVLDTNIFFNNWHLRNAEFARLIEHANSVAATILVSQVVIDEVNAKYGQHYSELQNDLTSLISRAKRLVPDRAIDWPVFASKEPYDLLALLQSYFHSVKYASYEKIGHQRLVSKAIREERPFQKSEKGYRDALFWLTILDFLDENRSDRHVAFITENKSDFFSSSKPEDLELHEHLKADWRGKSFENKLFLYSKLSRFNDDQLSPSEQIIDMEVFHDEYIELIEEGLSGAVREYLEGPGTLELLRKLCLASVIVEHSYWNILEGFEDTELMQVVPLSNSLSYVLCRFNLRAIYISLTVARDVYNAHKRDIDLTFQRVTTNGELMELEIGLRCYLTATALINTKTSDISAIDFEIERFRP